MRHPTRSIALAFLICLITAGQALAVPHYQPQIPTGTLPAGDTLKIRQTRILAGEAAKIKSVLDDRINDPEILAKTWEKVLTLPAEEVHLVSALCDRISASERTARADVVFSLVTALIVLS